jgi:hypothetical protein
MSIHPAFDQPARLFPGAPIRGRKRLVFYDFALAKHSACSQFLGVPTPTPMLRAAALMFRAGRSLAWDKLLLPKARWLPEQGENIFCSVGVRILPNVGSLARTERSILNGATTKPVVH